MSVWERGPGMEAGLINVGAVVTAVEYVMLCYIRRKSQCRYKQRVGFPFVLSLSPLTVCGQMRFIIRPSRTTDLSRRPLAPTGGVRNSAFPFWVSPYVIRASSPVALPDLASPKGHVSRPLCLQTLHG